MSPEPASTDNTQIVGSRRPGAELKQQREAAGHDLAAVAKDTYITRAKLAALESDDYEKVGSHTFVVGYIRKYAKWLNVNADPLVQAFEDVVARPALDSADAMESQQRHQNADNQSPSRQNPSNRKQINQGSGAGFRSITGLPLLWIVAGLLAVWVVAALWLSNSDNGAEPTSSQKRALATDMMPVPDTGQGSRASAGADSAAEEKRGMPSATDESAATGNEGVKGDGADTRSGIGAVPGTTSAIDSTAEPTATTPAVREDAEGEASFYSATPDTLVMSFSDDCWVEISDAHGELLFARLRQAGDNLQLSGQAPFTVMLGKARAVDLQVNGRPVSTDPGPTRDTMRLTVGP